MFTNKKVFTKFVVPKQSPKSLEIQYSIFVRNLMYFKATSRVSQDTQ